MINVNKFENVKKTKNVNKIEHVNKLKSMVLINVPINQAQRLTKKIEFLPLLFAAYFSPLQKNSRQTTPHSVKYARRLWSVMLGPKKTHCCSKWVSFRIKVISLWHDGYSAGRTTLNQDSDPFQTCWTLSPLSFLLFSS